MYFGFLDDKERTHIGGEDGEAEDEAGPQQSTERRNILGSEEMKCVECQEERGVTQLPAASLSRLSADGSAIPCYSIILNRELLRAELLSSVPLCGCSLEPECECVRCETGDGGGMKKAKSGTHSLSLLRVRRSKHKGSSRSSLCCMQPVHRDC